MNSYHLTGHAVDIAPIIDGQVSWDWKHYFPMIEAVKEAAIDLNVKVKWGGTWRYLNDEARILNAKILSKSFPDGPHLQIDR